MGEVTRRLRGRIEAGRFLGRLAPRGAHVGRVVRAGELDPLVHPERLGEELPRFGRVSTPELHHPGVAKERRARRGRAASGPARARGLQEAREPAVVVLGREVRAGALHRLLRHPFGPPVLRERTRREEQQQRDDGEQARQRRATIRNPTRSCHSVPASMSRPSAAWQVAVVEL